MIEVVTALRARATDGGWVSSKRKLVLSATLASFVALGMVANAAGEPLACLSVRQSRVAVLGVTEARFDQSGRVVQQTWDSSPLGEVDRWCETRWIDAVQRRETCWNVLGAEDLPTVREWSALSPHMLELRADRNGDGDFESVLVERRNPAGEVVQGVEFRGDATTVQNYTYDEAGRLLAVETDEGGDGEVDYRFLYEYDGDGALLTTMLVTARSEEVSRWTVFEYDPHRRLAVETRYAISEREIHFEYAYDSANRLVQTRSSGWSAGTVTTTVAYDLQGRVRRRGTDFGTDGQVDEFVDHHYECSEEALF